jgi:hypothetical protein
MKWHENKTVRLFGSAAVGALLVRGLLELTQWLLGQSGRGGADLMGELAGSKLLFTRMAVFFVGMSVAYAAFGKQNERWKMIGSVLFLGLLMQPITGGTFGAMDRVLLFTGAAALAVHELSSTMHRFVGSLLAGIVVIMLTVADIEAFRRNPGATLIIVAAFMAPTILLTTFAMDGELNLAPARRWLAKAVPVRS